MRANVLEIPTTNRESQRNLRLDKSIRQSVRDHLKARWPYGTAKAAAKFYDITEDRAREAAAGRASLTTIEVIFKRGGPPVFLPILEEVWGQSIARFFIEMEQAHAENGRAIAALVSNPWSGGPGGPDGLAGGPGVGADRSFSARREVGSRASR